MIIKHGDGQIINIIKAKNTDEEEEFEEEMEEKIKKALDSKKDDTKNIIINGNKMRFNTESIN